MVEGVMVETCCASDGNVELSGMNLSTLDACILVSDTTPSDVSTRTIAVGVILAFAALQVAM